MASLMRDKRGFLPLMPILVIIGLILVLIVLGGFAFQFSVFTQNHPRLLGLLIIGATATAFVMAKGKLDFRLALLFLAIGAALFVFGGVIQRVI